MSARRFDGSSFGLGGSGRPGLPEIVHTPGMAAEIMGQLKPLLAAEGVDLDNLTEDMDLDRLNAAMASAAERYNMELSTPVGAARERALRVLNRAAVAFAAGESADGLATLEEAGPEPTDTAPSVAHVTGVALGALDTWFTDPTLKEALHSVRIPALEDGHRIAAAHIVLDARSGSASADSTLLTVRHGGPAVQVGAALAVAAALEALALHDDVSVAVAAERHLGGTATPGTAATGGGGARRPSGKQARKARKQAKHRTLLRIDDALLKNTTVWFARHRISERAVVDMFSDNLFRVFETSRMAGLNLDEPQDAMTLIGLFFAAMDPSDKMQDRLLNALAFYVQYRESESGPDSEWYEVDEILEEAQRAAEGDPDEDEDPYDDRFEDDGFDDGWADDELPELTWDPDAAAALLGAKTPAQQAAELVEATAALKAVSGVGQLLGWIGTSRQLTATGGVRRSDIGTVAGFLGLDVVGAASTGFPDESSRRVQSMWDVEVLAVWWNVLLGEGVLEASPSRVRPGNAAQDWIDGPGYAEIAELLGGLVVDAVLPSLADEDEAHAWNEDSAVLVLNALGAALLEGGGTVRDEEGRSLITRVDAARRVRTLAGLGIVELSDDGVVTIQEALRPLVLQSCREVLFMLEAGV